MPKPVHSPKSMAGEAIVVSHPACPHEKTGRSMDETNKNHSKVGFPNEIEFPGVMLGLNDSQIDLITVDFESLKPGICFKLRSSIKIYFHVNC